MGNFFDNKLKPYEKNKIVVNDLVTTENYRVHHKIVKDILLDSLTSQAFNELSMRLIGTIYVFSEDELKDLLENR